MMECPFCNSNNIDMIAKVYLPRYETDIQINRWYVGCKECGAMGGERDTKDEALQAWNNRNGGEK